MTRGAPDFRWNAPLFEFSREPEDPETAWSLLVRWRPLAVLVLVLVSIAVVLWS